MPNGFSFRFVEGAYPEKSMLIYLKRNESLTDVILPIDIDRKFGRSVWRAVDFIWHFMPAMYSELSID